MGRGGANRWVPTPKSTSSGDRTHDHKIKSLALYHLSYGGLSDVGLVRAGFEPHRPLGSNPMESI